MRLFKRNSQIIIGKIGGEGKLITGIRFSFEIQMTDSKETNKGKINIYNLTDETIGLLEQKDTSIILKIGYDDEDLSTLFIGDIIEFEHDYSGVDVVTKVICKDGFNTLTKNKLSLSFDSGATSQQIINRIIAELNLTKGDYSTLPNFIYNQGFSFIGTPGSALDIVLTRIGYEWKIINNVLIITKPNDSNNTTIAQFISPATGLIDKPKRFKNKPIKTKTKNNKLIDGWKIKSLLIPSIQPKSLIQVESDDVSGTFLVKEATFTGDTHDQDWYVEMEAIQK